MLIVEAEHHFAMLQNKDAKESAGPSSIKLLLKKIIGQRQPNATLDSSLPRA